MEVEWDGCGHGVVEALFDYPVLVDSAPILVEAGESGGTINIMRHAASFLAFTAWKNECNLLHDHCCLVFVRGQERNHGLQQNCRQAIRRLRSGT